MHRRATELAARVLAESATAGAVRGAARQGPEHASRVTWAALGRLLAQSTALTAEPGSPQPVVSIRRER